MRRPPPASRDCLREESNTCGSLLAKHLPQGAQALRGAGQPVVAGLVLRQEPGRSSTFATRPAGNDRRAFIVILNRNSRLQSPRRRCRSRRAQSGVGRRRPGVPSRLYGARWGGFGGRHSLAWAARDNRMSGIRAENARKETLETAAILNMAAFHWRRRARRARPTLRTHDLRGFSGRARSPSAPFPWFPAILRIAVEKAPRLDECSGLT